MTGLPSTLCGDDDVPATGHSVSVHLGLDDGLDLADMVQPLDLSLIVEAAAAADDVLGDGVVDGGDLELVCVELDVWLDLAVIVQPLVLSLVVEVAGGADDGVEAGAVVESAATDFRSQI